MTVRVPERWTAGVKTAQEKQERKAQVRSTKPILDILKKMLEKDLDSSKKKMESTDNFNSPNWEYLMADYLAEQRTLRKVIDLLPKGEYSDD